MVRWPSINQNLSGFRRNNLLTKESLKAKSITSFKPVASSKPLSSPKPLPLSVAFALKCLVLGVLWTLLGWSEAGAQTKIYHADGNYQGSLRYVVDGDRIYYVDYLDYQRTSILYLLSESKRYS